MANGITMGQVLRQLPTLLCDCVTNCVIKRFRPLPPTVMQLNVTMMCNSRCLTCNIWKDKSHKEFDIYQWKTMLADPLFRNIEYLTVAGGEPTLRNDLSQIVGLCLKSMVNLRKVIIATNGLVKGKIMKQIPHIIDDCAKKGVQITISVSLDGVGKKHDTIRGITGHFEKTMQSIQYLRHLQQGREFKLSLGTTISNFNAHDLSQISDFCKEEGLPVAYYLSWTSKEYYNNVERTKDITISQDKIPLVVNFLRDQIANSPILSGHSYYYQKAIELLRNKKRTFPCLYADQGIIVDGTGDVRYCNNSKKIGNASYGEASKIYYDQDNLAYRLNLASEICPDCSSECLVGIAIQKRIFPYIRHLIGCKLPA